MQIMIADDHAVTRAGMKALVQELANDVEVIEAATFPELMEKTRKNPGISLILLDLKMPGGAGIDNIKSLREILPQTPLVVISASESPPEIRLCLDYGANGFIPKSATGEVMVSALRLVMAGEQYVPGTLISRYNQPIICGENGDLTPREAELLTLLCEGLSNKEIGLRLGLNETTVKTHMRNIFRKLGVSSRSQAMISAMNIGIVKK